MHPLTPDLKKLTDMELSDKLRDLTVRLSQAYRFGNPGLISQVSSILEDYQFEQGRRQQAELEKLMDKNKDKFKGIIDIS